MWLQCTYISSLSKVHTVHTLMAITMEKVAQGLSRCTMNYSSHYFIKEKEKNRAQREYRSTKMWRTILLPIDLFTMMIAFSYLVPSWIMDWWNWNHLRGKSIKSILWQLYRTIQVPTWQDLTERRSNALLITRGPFLPMSYINFHGWFCFHSDCILRKLK